MAEGQDCGVQSGEGGWGDDLNRWDEHRGGTERLKLRGKRGGLMAGAGDQDARRGQDGSRFIRTADEPRADSR
jgi:hypothetical protein